MLNINLYFLASVNIITSISLIMKLIISSSRKSVCFHSKEIWNKNLIVLMPRWNETWLWKNLYRNIIDVFSINRDAIYRSTLKLLVVKRNHSIHSYNGTIYLSRPTQSLRFQLFFNSRYSTVPMYDCQLEYFGKIWY